MVFLNTTYKERDKSPNKRGTSNKNPSKSIFFAFINKSVSLKI